MAGGRRFPRANGCSRTCPAPARSLSLRLPFTRVPLFHPVRLAEILNLRGGVSVGAPLRFVPRAAARDIRPEETCLDFERELARQAQKLCTNHFTFVFCTQKGTTV